MSSTTMTNPLLVLADHAATWHSRPLDAEVAHHARRALVDWFAALLAGAWRDPLLLERLLPPPPGAPAASTLHLQSMCQGCGSNASNAVFLARDPRFAGGANLESRLAAVGVLSYKLTRCKTHTTEH